MRRLGTVAAGALLSGAAWGQGTLVNPSPLSTPQPLSAPAPLYVPPRFTDPAPLMPSTPLMGGPVPMTRGQPTTGADGQRPPREQAGGRQPCPPVLPRQPSLTTSGSGPGEYGQYVPGAARPGAAGTRTGTRPTNGNDRGGNQVAGTPGVDRPLGGGPERPLWPGAPGGMPSTPSTPPNWVEGRPDALDQGVPRPDAGAGQGAGTVPGTNPGTADAGAAGCVQPQPVRSDPLWPNAPARRY